MFKRKIYNNFFSRFLGHPQFIQVLAGPRQIGKTTLAKQIMGQINYPSHYASADALGANSLVWIEQQWNVIRSLQNQNEPTLLILDEIQKIPQWPEMVKKLWDEDKQNNSPKHVILLGSSQLLLQKGLSESLTGRFEVTPITHWSYEEMRDAFNFDIDEYIYFGGYPGAAQLIREENRWRDYILNSLIEPTISKDILMMTRIDKPILLRHLFELGCAYSGQILSYQKMLGQLQDAGNTTTLAHYLNLLESAGLLAGLPKFFTQKFRQKQSSPKLQILNNALMSAYMVDSYLQTKSNPQIWGRFVESCIGAKLINETTGSSFKVSYWRERNYEVDFVLTYLDQIIAIEVKSGKKKEYLPGLELFAKNNPNCKKLLIGADGIPINDFLLMPIKNLF
ncbi:MAG: AAA family ATPase [Candidatus Margulisiibacteriota bacterium]|jgi:hypothetical protein